MVICFKGQDSFLALVSSVFLTSFKWFASVSLDTQVFVIFLLVQELSVWETSWAGVLSECVSYNNFHRQAQFLN